MLNELKREYLELCHALQSGVAFKMTLDNSETRPKHLRVGVNSALVSNSALMRLLLKKKIITEIEYYQELNIVMEEEVKNYQSWLSEHMDKDVILM